MKAILADPAIKEALVSMAPTSRQNRFQMCSVNSRCGTSVRQFSHLLVTSSRFRSSLLWRKATVKC